VPKLSGVNNALMTGTARVQAGEWWWDPPGCSRRVMMGTSGVSWAPPDSAAEEPSNAGVVRQVPRPFDRCPQHAHSIEPSADNITSKKAATVYPESLCRHCRSREREYQEADSM